MTTPRSNVVLTHSFIIYHVLLRPGQSNLPMELERVFVIV